MFVSDRILGDFFVFLVIGFFAQLADEALGMGFGVISSSLLLAQGVPPPLVSAAVNAAKIPTGAAAGLSHWLNGNINPRLLWRLALSGALGGLIGALALAHLEGPWLMVLIAVYLILIGGLILWRAATGHAPTVIASRRSTVIGGAGGLIEGIGGSWGPVVTSSLLASGTDPRRAIGSSAMAECLVSVTVFLALYISHHLGVWSAGDGAAALLWPVAGLVAGGLPAALLGGRIAARVPRRPLAAAVGVLALGIGLYRGWQLF